MSATPGRYARQELFLGAAGQARLGAATAVVVGCGALGCTAATILARAGVGRLRLVDRDYVDLSNLQRQILYDEEDAARATPKAVAAAAHLRRANSTIVIEPCVEDFTPGSAARLLGDADVVVDGLDNFEGRFLLNDFAVRAGKPWIYGAAVGSYGLVMPVLPGAGPCLRCLQAEEPPPGTAPTCDTVGIVASIAVAVASLEAAEAVKILAGRRDLVVPQLTALDLWPGSLQTIAVARADDCPCCAARRFEYLDGARGRAAATQCGRHAVQHAPGGGPGDHAAIAAQLAAVGTVTRNEYLVRAQLEGYELTVFRDGRALVVGTHDPVVARGVYAKYVGG